ncbi:MAG TPA: glycosyltransferase [Terriglobales bacterium]|nr:glycosyltransferase [Terriglobales bacterium]
MSAPLRILHVTPTLTAGGAEHMATHLMVGLSKSHAVGAVGLFPAAHSAVERRLAEADIPRWHLNKRAGFDPRMFASLNRAFREFRPDVVHTHMAVQRYVFPVVLRHRTVVAIHTVHNLAEHETDAFGRWVHRFAFRNRVLPIGISQEVSASVQRIYGMECKAVIPNCIPVENYRHKPEERIRWRAENGLSSDAIVFTCVGRLEPQKNPLLLLQAFAELKYSHAHLVLSGDGSLREQLKAYVKAQKLGDRVHLLGKQNNVPNILAASDVFVLSSNWEGNPLAVMEAMAAGLPVIATQVGGVPELVQSGDQGFLVPAGDCIRFTGAMKALIDSAETRHAMGRAAQTRAMREFKVERMVEGYANLYREMVQKSRGTQLKAMTRWAASQT